LIPSMSCRRAGHGDIAVDKLLAAVISPCFHSQGFFCGYIVT
jgi:hypothetical protein